MGKRHKPRSGSLAYYPRKRAKKETPSFSSMPEMKTEEVKPLNFFGYKAGMTHVIGKNAHSNSVTYGSELSVPCTVIECPPLKVFGVRAYEKTTSGLKSLKEVLVEKTEKHLKKRIKSIGRKKSKHDLKEIENSLGEVSEIRLLVHTQPYATGIGKKKPEVSEIHLSGKVEGQFAFAKDKLGKELKLEEVFKEKQFLDVRGVTKGKGFQGVIKRFGVKMHRPKAKKRRIVGAISPWKPSTVMWTVARPGQMGYHNRTEYNKRIIMLGNKPESINLDGGFPNYGIIKNDFLVLGGSTPGAIKRCIALRQPIRKTEEKKSDVEEVSVIGIKKGEGK